MGVTENTPPTAAKEVPPRMVSTVEESFEVLKSLFQPNNAFAGVDRTVEYQISGEDGGPWTVRIRNRSCQTEKGEAADADFVLSANRDDWLDMVNGKLVDDFGRFTILRKGPPQYDEDSEYSLALDQEQELRVLGLLGREFVLPLWARSAGLTEVSQLHDITSKYGELDHEEFVKFMNTREDLELGPKAFTESLHARDFRRVTWPVAGLLLCTWLLLPLVVCLFPLAFLVGWKFGLYVGMLVGLVSFFLVPGTAVWAEKVVIRRFGRAALTDPGFFRFAFEHGIIRRGTYSDKVDSSSGCFWYFLTLPVLLLSACLWLVYVLFVVGKELLLFLIQMVS